MDVKEAVALAKQYILELFGEERVSNVGLEEVELDPSGKGWSVTVGFSRPWDEPRNALAALSREMIYPKRSYKVVQISNETGHVLSVKNRDEPS